MAPGSTAGTVSSWGVRVTTSSYTYTLTSDNDTWPDTCLSGYFNRYDNELVDDGTATPVMTRALQLLLWTREALVRAAVEAR